MKCLKKSKTSNNMMVIQRDLNYNLSISYLGLATLNKLILSKLKDKNIIFKNVLLLPNQNNLITLKNIIKLEFIYYGKINSPLPKCPKIIIR